MIKLISGKMVYVHRQVTDMDMIPLTLILTGIILGLVEIAFAGQTFLFVPGAFFIVLGGTLALWPDNPDSWMLGSAMGIVAAVVVFVAIIAFYRKFGKPTSPPETQVGESLIGKHGRVVKKVVDDDITGKVKIGTTVWSARCESGEIEEGATVEVVDSEGVHVVVTPVKEAEELEAAEEEIAEEEF